VQVGDQFAAARLWATSQAPYLATALFAMSFNPAPGLGTAGVDRHWRLYIDPAAADRWSVEELGSVLIHEVNHLIRAHADRAETLGVGPAEKTRFNVAADCEINDDLRDLQLPPGGVDPERFGFEPGGIAETYYILLESARSPMTAQCGSGAHGVRQPWERADLDDQAVEPVEAELIRQQLAAGIREAVQHGGHVPAGLERWARAFLQPAVDWRRELRAQIRAGINTVSGGVDYSYRRPSRRNGTPVGRAVILPALVQPLPTVAVVVDTSGSMSAAALERALAEIKGLLQSTSAVHTRLAVLACDTMIRTTQAVFSAAQVRLAGGGGTDMRVGLDAAFELRPRPDLVVVATDGFTPWPEQRPAGVVVVALIGEGPEPPRWARFVRVPVAADGAD